MSASRRTWMCLGAAALVATACSDNPTAPAKPADPLATAAQVQALNQSFSSPTFRSFSVVAAQSPVASNPLAALQAVLSAAYQSASGRPTLSASESQRVATALRAALQPSAAPMAAIFPPEILGKTYEWNTTTLRYEATSRTGAAPNGVRFIMYALDASGTPVATQEIGYADLMDESSGGTQRLHLLVVGTTTDPPVTYLDYTISATASATSGSVTIVGFITDGEHRLDFNTTVSATSASATVDIRFDVNADNAHVRLQLTLTPIGSTGLRLDVTFRLQLGTEVVTVVGTDTVTDAGESGSFTVEVNGGIYATITITNGTPSFAGGGGQDLTADDLTALNAIFEAIADVLAHFNELLEPGGSLAG